MTATVYIVICFRRMYRTPLLIALLSPVVTASLTFTIPRSPHAVYLCVLYGS
jgi:hypothetical protein